MKTIGIITFHDPISYGANLQCLGLQLYLKSVGYEARIIDYSMNSYLEYKNRNKTKKNLIRLYNLIKNPISFIKYRINARAIAKEKEKYRDNLLLRDSNFKTFQKENYNYSEEKYSKISDLKNNPPKYDAYICGSDQIWNPNFCEMDDNYFLTFAPENKRISYAPSFGVSNIPFYAKKKYKNNILGIKYLSIREKTGAKIIKKLTGRNAAIVIDPTFLVSKDKWFNLADKSKIKTPKKYILTYFIGIDEYIESYIAKIKEQFNDIEIIDLVFDKTSYGPYDFLKLIKNASFVFTNSFHGVAFCINMNIPFAVGKTLKDKSKNSAFSRIDDLLTALDLQTRICDNDTVINSNYLKLDYKAFNKKLDLIVSESKKFLDESINNIEK